MRGTPFLAVCYLRVIHVRTCSCYVLDGMVSRASTRMRAKPGSTFETQVTQQSQVPYIGRGGVSIDAC